MDRRKWTAGEHAYLVAELKKGTPYHEIGRVLGRSIESVGMRVLRTKISPRRGTYRYLSPDARKIIGYHLRSGGTTEAAARAANVSTSTVRAVRRLLGIPPLSSSEFHRKGAEVRLSKPEYRRPTVQQARVVAALSDGPLRLGELHRRLGRRCSMWVTRRQLMSLRRKGIVACEGNKCGRGCRWFAVGQWVVANNGLIHQQVRKLLTVFRWMDGDDLYQQFVVELYKCARSFRPTGRKFSTYAIGPSTLSVATRCRLETARGVHCPENNARTLGSPVVQHELNGHYEYHRVRAAPDAPVVDESFWDKAASAPDLTDRERDALVSHFRAGQTYQTIADRYELSREMIRVTIGKALEKVRASGVLGEYAPD